jgi:hypothetical protein
MPMAEDNKGFLYENNLNKLLKQYGVEKKSFMGAGADSNAPDAMLTLGGEDYKVEVKLDLKVDFGQGSLDYDLDKETWQLGGAKTASGEAMREFLTMIGVPKLVNKAWGKYGPPRKFTVPPAKYKKSDVDYDYKSFKDQFLSVDSDAISDYYASKKTYYIQIGGKGLYMMGKDPAKLGVPKFKPMIRLRIRLKRGGSMPIYNYRFTTALQVVSIADSQHDLEDTDFLKAILARSKK